jgi:CheY-like chemotaxis protein
MDSSINVLVVDDEFFVCKSVQKILAAESMNTEIAMSGPEGLMKVRGRKYDLIFVDVKMPEMDGFEFIRILREIQADVPVIVISGYNTPQMRDQSSEHTAVRFVPKPFTPEEVRAAVYEVLESRSAAAARGEGAEMADAPARNPRLAVGYVCAIDLEAEGVVSPAEKQIERVKKFSGANNLKLKDIFEDSDRAVEILERPAMRKLLNEEEKAGVIIIDRIWSLSRKREKLQPFLHALTEKGFTLEVVTTMMDVASQYVRAWKETGAFAFGEDREKSE